MILWILNESFEQVGVIDDYRSVIWAKRYRELGDCEIYISASDRTLELLRKGYYILRSDEDMVCRIEGIEIDTDTEEGNYLIVTGYDCRKILNQRIVWLQTNFSGTVEDFIRKIINENIINPTKANRKIAQFELGERKGFEETIEIQSTYDYVFDKIKELCTTYEYGTSVTFDGSKFIFDLYKGVDRSEGQSTNDVVIFSPEYENLISSTYKSDSSLFKNAALIAGEGEGAERARVEIDVGDGLNRYELYVDAKDVSSKTEQEVQLTEEEYQELLLQRGYEKLSENSTVVSFNGEVEPNYSYQYGVDYFLGDIVTVKNEYGIKEHARIIEVIESHDENGYSIIPTFEYIDTGVTRYLLTEDNEFITTEDGSRLAY